MQLKIFSFRTNPLAGAERHCCRTRWSRIARNP
jgi:hypothetical protein